MDPIKCPICQSPLTNVSASGELFCTTGHAVDVIPWQEGTPLAAGVGSYLELSLELVRVFGSLARVAFKDTDLHGLIREEVYGWQVVAVSLTPDRLGWRAVYVRRLQTQEVLFICPNCQGPILEGMIAASVGHDGEIRMTVGCGSCSRNMVLLASNPAGLTVRSVVQAGEGETPQRKGRAGLGHHA